MSDEDTVLPTEAPQRRQGDLVLYDYFKHLTTLSLLVLGGILTLSQTDKGDALKLPTLLAVIAVVTVAGAVSFTASGEIARAHFHGDEPKHIDFSRKAAPALLCIGVGIFLFLFHAVLRT